MGLAVIPDDWTSGYVELCVKWPDSTDWRAILRGLLTSPNDVEFWDKFTGDPDDPKAAISETFDQNLHLEECIMIPPGIVSSYAGETAPSGWLECDGSDVSRTTYADLFAAIGTFWGNGNGTTTFTLPNPGGRVIQAFYPDLPELGEIGDQFGENQHTLEISELPVHTHTQNSHNHNQNSHNHTQDSHTHTQNSHTHPVGVPNNVVAGASAAYSAMPYQGWNSAAQTTPKYTSDATTPTNQSATPTNQSATPTNQSTTPTNQNTGGDGAHENRQPTIVMMCIIKT